jgi:hypothetical protein
MRAAVVASVSGYFALAVVGLLGLAKSYRIGEKSKKAPMKNLPSLILNTQQPE